MHVRMCVLYVCVCVCVCVRVCVFVCVCVYVSVHGEGEARVVNPFVFSYNYACISHCSMASSEWEEVVTRTTTVYMSSGSD